MCLEKPTGDYQQGVISCENEDPSVSAVNNGFQRLPTTGHDQSFAAEGIPMASYSQLNQVEWGFDNFNGGLVRLKTAFAAYRTLYDYTRRTGYSQWPHAAKIPYIGLGKDSCAAKAATPLPTPKDLVTPWSLTTTARIDLT